MKHSTFLRGSVSVPRWLLALAAGAHFSTAHAVDVTVTGAAGANGTPGTSNNALTPGTPGGPGGHGGDAVADATSGDPTNRATATGGLGGRGGDGGSGSAGAGAGAGGNGGNAGATAKTNNSNPTPAGPLLTNATARGGNGGAGGFGGFGAGGTNGDGADGGLGGSAIAAAAMTGALGLPLPGVMWNEVLAVATGGLGGNGHSRGGEPGVGGDSGAGGGALATAHASGVTGAGHLLVSATQTGGSAGFSASGGQAGNGADSVMLNAVSGTTLFPYQLELRQMAVAGGAGHAFDPAVGNAIENILTTPGMAGHASSLLTASNPGGGILLAQVSATGGNGGDNGTGINTPYSGGPLVVSGDATVGGSGTAGASLTAEQSVIGFVTARGGAGGKAEGRGALGLGGNGGAAVLAPIFGQTTTPGSVTITAVAAGGSGGGSEKGIGGNGAAVNLSNELDGDPGATGQLFLIQRAVGGAGGFSFDGTLGQAGDATSTLHMTKSVESFRSEVVAEGGTGAARRFTSGLAGPGGTATASNTGRNNAGSLTLRARANGGAGGEGNNNIPGAPALAAQTASSGDGGLAFSTAIGTTGFNDLPLFVDALATGGNAGQTPWGHAALALGDGGNAASTAQGTLLGSSTAVVASSAGGGRGGSTGQMVGPGTDGPAGHGGHADATASVAALGGSASVRASAGGGAGGGTSAATQPGGNGGTATASASGISSGDASLTVGAFASGGGGGDGFNGGNGASTSLTNAVTGSTSGSLTLQQQAGGGHGGAAFGAGTPGLAGQASSSLTRVDLTAAILYGDILAAGGNGGSVFAPGVVGAAGGHALAALDLTGIGDVTAIAAAIGGAGGSSQALDGGAPGLATLGTVRGISTGGGAVLVTGSVFGGKGGSTGAAMPMPGQSVSLNNAVTGTTTGWLSLEQVAEGGNGGTFNSLAPGVGAPGGAATSILTRSAAVPVLSLVASGTGGLGGASALGSVGSGGAGIATTQGTNTQTGGSVAVSALARGGLPGLRYGLTLDATAGRATATATGSATGAGASASVAADAVSLRRASDPGGGDSGPILASTQGDTAHAVATATGPGGTVSARAQSYGGAVLDLVTTSDVNLLQASSTESRVGVAAASASLTGNRQAFSLATALPLAVDTASAVLGNPDATIAFTLHDPDVFALGLLGGAFAQSAAAAPLLSSASLALSIETAQLTNPRHLLVGLMNPTVTGAGFDTLRFTLRVEDSLLVDLTFTDVASALSYFDDRVFDFGPIDPWTPPPTLEVPTLDVVAQFTVTTSAPGDGFSAQALVANNQPVPEPAAALLLVAGAAGLGLRRRRAR